MRRQVIAAGLGLGLVLVATPAQAAVPGTPGDVTAVGHVESADVSWTAPGPGVDFYLVTSWPDGSPAQTTTKTTTATAITLTPLAAGTWDVTVAAHDSDGYGPASAPVMATVSPQPPPPGKPTDITVTPTGSVLHVTWTAPDPGGTTLAGYYVDCSSENNRTGGYSPAAADATSADVTVTPVDNSYGCEVTANFADGSSTTGLSPGIIYYYVPPQPITDPHATPTDTGVTLVWTGGQGGYYANSPAHVPGSSTELSAHGCGLSIDNASIPNALYALAVPTARCTFTVVLTGDDGQDDPVTFSATSGDRAPSTGATITAVAETATTAHVTWTQPSTATGASLLDGTTVVVTRTNPKGTPVTTTSQVTGTSLSLTGLTSGTRVTVALAPHNAAGAAPQTATTFTSGVTLSKPTAGRTKPHGPRVVSTTVSKRSAGVTLSPVKVRVTERKGATVHHLTVLTSKGVAHVPQRTGRWTYTFSLVEHPATSVTRTL